MTTKTLKQQTNKEFYGYFKDNLKSKVDAYFDSKNLVFVSYQPVKLTLLPGHVSDQTKSIFRELTYVEVLEENYKVNKRYNYSNYIGGYHSHLICNADVFEKIKDKYNLKNIVFKYVYDIEGLVIYLSKQAFRNRILPTLHIKKTPGTDIANVLKETKGKTKRNISSIKQQPLIESPYSETKDKKKKQKINKVTKRLKYIAKTKNLIKRSNKLYKTIKPSIKRFYITYLPGSSYIDSALNRILKTSYLLIKKLCFK